MQNLQGSKSASGLNRRILRKLPSANQIFELLHSMEAVTPSQLQLLPRVMESKASEELKRLCKKNLASRLSATEDRIAGVRRRDE